jgi:bifunctional aspartokinase / homoserine dehydrogenase 1
MAGTAAGKTTATVDIAIIGATGRVGRRLLELIDARRALLQQRSGLRLRIVAAANSTRWLHVPDHVPATRVPELLAAASPPPDALALTRAPLQPRVLVDCSASAQIAALYPRWLGAGVDVVTPNKLGSSAERPLAQAITAAQAGGGVLHDNTTVGAQLPLLSTLRDLHRAGDRIERFEAVLSGTLSYVLGRLQQGIALSTAVNEAVRNGYAEPHPGRDLSGEDAARKLVILLRALGHDVELGDIECAPLVDAALLAAADPASLLARLEQADAGWRARVAVADVRHERWVYRASFENGRARIAPERLAQSHAFARLAPCENALILHSDFYRAAPLTIAGPGAGIDLTAAGVFADLVAAAQRRAPTRDESAQPVGVAA